MTDYTSSGVSGARVHTGFNEAYQKQASTITEKVTRLMNRYRTYTLVVTGHSLGGAFATLCAIDLYEKNVTSRNIRLWTYGSPRVGNDVFASYVQRALPEYYRVVNENDVVPHVPFKFMGYRHPPTEVWIKDNWRRNVRVCDENNGEDPTCSNSIRQDSPDTERDSLLSRWDSILNHAKAYDTLFGPFCF